MPASDWHAHTHFSDGFSSPEELVTAAIACGLERLAITDHDCVEAHRGGRLRELAARRIEIVTGVEIDCLLDDARIELLGLGFDPEAPALVGRLAEIQADRRRRFGFYCERMREAGEPVEIESLSSCASLALLKVHLYRALVAAGRCFPGGYREFSARLETLGEAPRVRTPTAAEAARLIQEAGGRILLAHPLYYAERVGLERLLRAGRDLGCSGLEYLYPYDFGPEGRTRPALLELYRELDARLAEIFPRDAELTQGSDVHDPAEWPARLALIAEWAGLLGRPLG